MNQPGTTLTDPEHPTITDPLMRLLTEAGIDAEVVYEGLAVDCICHPFVTAAA
jgi:hypothetical protein